MARIAAPAPDIGGRGGEAGSIRIFVSSSNRERLDAAHSFVAGFPAGTELLLVGADRGAVDELVREITANAGASFGLRRVSLGQLAAILATDILAVRGLAPATPLGSEAVAARCAFEARAQGAVSELGPMIEFPGFARALARTLGELRMAGVEPHALHHRGSPDLAALERGYDDELSRAALADRATLLDLATQALAHPRDRALRTAPVLLLDLPVHHRAEADLVGVLMGERRSVLATVPTGDDVTLDRLRALGRAEVHHADRPVPGSSLENLREHLFSDEQPPAGALDERVEFFSAPGEARECIEIVRRILDEAERGVPFDRMAVLVRTPEAYASHLESALRRAGVPSYFARGTRRPDSSGRAFLALLACKAEGLSARRFAEYLSFAQVPELDATGAPPADVERWVPSREETLGRAATEAQLSFDFIQEPAAEDPPVPDAAAVPDTDDRPTLGGALRAPWKWEEYLVEAAVIGGRERWERRLRGLESELRLKLERTAGEEPDSPRLAALARDLVHLGHLQRFALPVIGALDRLPARATWSAWLEALQRLAPSVLRHPDRVLSVLAELQPMAKVGPAGLEEVRVVLAPRLTMLEQEPPAHRYGRVYVGTPEHARGRSFAVVFVPGLAERSFPQRPREDPLLLDEARHALSSELDTQEDRGTRERIRFRLAVGAAERRVVLSYPRLEVVEARPRVPSFYGLDVMRAVQGEIPHHDELERRAAETGAARLAWPAPEDPERALDAVEHDLAVLEPLFRDKAPRPGHARYLFDVNPHLARSLRSRWVRWERRWRPQDGIVRAEGPVAGILATHGLKRRAFSATGLQRYSVCPYQFLLASIHRLEPRREAVPLVRLDPLTRGSMIHEIQAQALRTLKAEGALPVRPAGLEHAIEVLDQAAAEVAARWFDDLAPAIPRVWDDEVRAIRGDLRLWMRRLMEDADRWVPIEFELGFGMPPRGAQDRPAFRDPVEIAGGWKLHGAVDLLEEKPDGSALRVTDHKTGSNRVRKGSILAGGEILQPVLYSLVVESAIGKPVQEARLSFCTARGGFTEHVVAMDRIARMGANLVLETIDGAIAAGALPPAPRRDACSICDFRVVCGQHEEKRFAKKDPSLVEKLVQLREWR